MVRLAELSSRAGGLGESFECCVFGRFVVSSGTLPMN